MNARILTLVATMTFCGSAFAEWSGSATLTSDYSFRGISQTLEDPAVQAGIDYNNESGFYVGTWASSVDFSDGAGFDDGASVEWDFYAGYGGNISESVSWDLSYVYFYYPGTSDGVDLNYSEVIFQLGFGDNFGALVGFSNDIFGTDDTGTYFNINTEHEIGQSFSIGGEIGYYELDDLNSSYTHWSLSLSRAIEQFDFSLSYQDTNGEDEFGDIAEARIILSVSTEF